MAEELRGRNSVSKNQESEKVLKENRNMMRRIAKLKIDSRKFFKKKLRGMKRSNCKE